ncbi:MAG TPA: adenine phosphoribosyltransferase [Elusimicrobiales bacterium]|nr:adenine phosphoribosyltransferase [Elusimicrobiales bacterium]
MTNSSTIEDLKSSIRDVVDFPKKGIVFKDITPLLQNPETLKKSLDLFVEKYKNQSIKKVVAIDARGFLFAVPVAIALNAGVIPVRKKGKLPYTTKAVTYSLEYGTDTVEMHEDAITAGEKVLIIDDVLATGGTANATAKLVTQAGGKVVGLAFLIELGFLKGREKLQGYDIFSIIKY